MAENRILVNTVAEDFGGNRQMIALNRWLVVNAPRPLPGMITWLGKFRHGTFYAAGKASEFGRQWDDLDAWEVVSLTNLEITEQLAAKAREAEVPLGDLVKDWGSMGALARAADFPWFDGGIGRVRRSGSG